VSEDDPWADRIDFLMEVMVSTYERRRFQTEVINKLPLYPTESILWDENQVPDVHYTGRREICVTEAPVTCVGAKCCCVQSQMLLVLAQNLSADTMSSCKPNACVDWYSAVPCLVPALPCPAMPCPALPCPALRKAAGLRSFKGVILSVYSILC